MVVELKLQFFHLGHINGFQIKKREVSDKRKEKSSALIAPAFCNYSNFELQFLPYLIRRKFELRLGFLRRNFTNSF